MGKISGTAVGTSYSNAEISVRVREEPSKNQINDVFDIMRESIVESFYCDEDIDIEEDNYREVSKYDENSYELFMEYSIRVKVKGFGWYEPSFTGGPPEDCYPADGDVDFNMPEIDKANISNYIKKYFEKYDSIKDLTLLDIDYYCSDLNEPDDYEIEGHDY